MRRAVRPVLHVACAAFLLLFTLTLYASTSRQTALPSPMPPGVTVTATPARPPAGPVTAPPRVRPTAAARIAPLPAPPPQVAPVARTQRGRAQQDRAPGHVSGRSASTAAPTSVLVQGRQLTRWLYSGQLERLWGRFGAPARADWASEFSAFKAYRASGLRAYGAETDVLNEEVVRDGRIRYYLRTATFARGPRAGWTLIFGLDPSGRVVEFGIVAAGLLPGAAGAFVR